MKFIILLVTVASFGLKIHSQDIDPSIFNYFDFDESTPKFEYTTLDPNSLFPSFHTETTEASSDKPAEQFTEWPNVAGTEDNVHDADESSRESTTKAIPDSRTEIPENSEESEEKLPEIPKKPKENDTERPEANPDKSNSVTEKPKIFEDSVPEITSTEEPPRTPETDVEQTTQVPETTSEIPQNSEESSNETTVPEEETTIPNPEVSNPDEQEVTELPEPEQDSEDNDNDLHFVGEKVPIPNETEDCDDDISPASIDIMKVLTGLVRRINEVPDDATRTVIEPSEDGLVLHFSDNLTPVYRSHRRCYHKMKGGPLYMYGDDEYGRLFDGYSVKRCFKCCETSIHYEQCSLTYARLCAPTSQTPSKTNVMRFFVNNWH